MMGFSAATFVDRLFSPPRIESVPGKPHLVVCQFFLGERERPLVECQAFGELGEAISRRFTQGDAVKVKGFFQQSIRTTREGRILSSVRLCVREIEAIHPDEPPMASLATPKSPLPQSSASIKRDESSRVESESLGDPS